MPAARGDEGALCIERATKGEDATRRVLYSLDYCTDSRGLLLYSNLSAGLGSCPTRANETLK